MEENQTQTELENTNTEEPSGSKTYDEVWNKDVSFDDLKDFTNESKEENTSKTINDIFEDKKENTDSRLITLTRPLKYRGKEIYPQTEEELIELAQKGLDYSFKMNKIQPYRELINYIENNNISVEEAMKRLSNNSSVVQTEPMNEYVSQTDDTNDDYSGHIMEGILNHYKRIDQRLAKKIFNTYESIDPQFKVELVNNNALAAFASSVANGEFENLYPETVKFKNNNPFVGWIEAYRTVGSSNVRDRKVEDTNDFDIKSKKQKQQRKNKTIEEQYNDIWDNGKINTVEDLEKILIEGV